jgi:hypothetical protein
MEHRIAGLLSLVRGHLALPGLVHAHAHLDKTLWGLPWRPHTAVAGLDSLHGVMEARAAFADQISVELVAFPQSGLLVRPGTAELLEAAVRTGGPAPGATRTWPPRASWPPRAGPRSWGWTATAWIPAAGPTSPWSSAGWRSTEWLEALECRFE